MNETPKKLSVYSADWAKEVKRGKKQQKKQKKPKDESIQTESWNDK